MKLEKLCICDGSNALMARNKAVENWLHNQVGPAYDALKADPSRSITADQIRNRITTKKANRK